MIASRVCALSECRGIAKLSFCKRTRHATTAMCCFFDGSWQMLPQMMPGQPLQQAAIFLPFCRGVRASRRVGRPKKQIGLGWAWPKPALRSRTANSPRKTGVAAKLYSLFLFVLGVGRKWDLDVVCHCKRMPPFVNSAVGSWAGEPCPCSQMLGLHLSHSKGPAF